MKVLILLACVAAVMSQPLEITTDEVEDWELFKIQHARDYTTTEEEEKRKAIFVNNLRFVKEHNEKYNKGEKTFTVAINKFADLTVEEFRAKKNGNRRSGKPKNGKPFIMSDDVSLPKSKDWRKLGAVTAVKDEGEYCNSDWAFSATGSLEGQAFLKTNVLTSLSEQNLIDCSSNQGNKGCYSGLADYAFEYIMENKGINNDTLYAYTGTKGNCHYNMTLVAATVSAYVDIPTGSEDDLKKAVAKVGPISVVVDGSHNSFQLYEKGVYNEEYCSSIYLDQAALAVGYGTQTTGGDYWLVKNSWGTDWGMSGYIMMSRNLDNQCGIATEASYPVV